MSYIKRDILPVLGLEHVQNQYVEDLSYGLQKRIELARAMVMRPKILLLDEPVAGMKPRGKARDGSTDQRAK